MMHQLLLAFDAILPPEPTLENFLWGDNEGIVSHLKTALTDKAGPPHRLTYLFGPTGSGKTHLLKAWVQGGKNSQYIDAEKDPLLESLPIEAEEKLHFLSIDHITSLNETGQQRVFHLCNRSRGHLLGLLVADRKPAAELMIREDLKMRFAHGTVWGLTPLSDAQKLDALKKQAAARAMRIQPETLQYLLTHTDRDLASLMRLVDLIDQVSLSEQQKPTLPMVRSVLSTLQAERQGR